MVKYCDCPCHDPDREILHFEACCEICPKCGKGIQSGIGEHFDACPGKLLEKRKREKAKYKGPVF